VEPATRRAEHEAETAAHEERGARRYLLLVVAVAVVATAGYVGYVLYPRFDLPAQEGAGLLALAAAAGFASFFSPCSFPLLLGLLGRQAVAQTTRGERAHPTLFGGALALGAVKRWAGWVLVAVGVWFIILAVFADLFMRIFPV
jgi:hypothetical protein